MASDSAVESEATRVRRQLVGSYKAFGQQRDAEKFATPAFVGAMMASSYAWVLAAVIQMAGEEAGPDLADRLAIFADDLLINGGGDGENLDVLE